MELARHREAWKAANEADKAIKNVRAYTQPDLKEAFLIGAERQLQKVKELLELLAKEQNKRSP